MIVCNICKKSFKKQITNSHLKTHGITTEEYKLKYGKESLSSESYKKEKSEKSKGKNNPNFGNRWSEEKKKELSRKLKGRIPYNKNKPMSEETKEKLRQKALERYKKWKKEKRIIKVTITQEIKEKISKSIKMYALKNKDKMKRRARKAVKTKISRGYYKILREKFLIRYRKNVEKHGLKLIDIENNFAILQCKVCDTLLKRHVQNVINERTCKTCNPTLFSKKETELYEFLKSLNIEVIRNDKSILNNGFELDFYIPSKNIAIEYNGLYWHSEKVGKGKWYHRTKRDKCEEKGINLIQIFEDEWVFKEEIVKNRLKAILGLCDTIYARKCKVTVIDRITAKKFVEKYHLYGYNYTPINYGLFFENNLVAVMTFTRPSRAKNQLKSNYDFELSRYCSIERVIGGGSKLFEKFLKDYDPKTVVSYSDLRWKTGKFYESLGFEFVGNTTPNYWYTKDYVRRIHRYKLRKKPEENKEMTEWQLRSKEGWDRIWDCGHAKYIWKK